jgi:hypothetical protein
MLRKFLLLPFYFVLGAELVAQRLWLSIPCGGGWAHNRECNGDFLFHVTATAIDSPDLGE